MIFSKIDAAQCQSDVPVTDLSDLIQAVCTDSFDSKLEKLLRTYFDIGEIFVFRWTAAEPGRPELISAPSDRAAQTRAEAYCATHFRDDPLFDILGADTPDGFYAVQIGADRIRNPRFRSACFAHPGYCEKLALARKEGGDLLILTIFAKTENGPFTPEQLARLNQLGTLILPLLCLHARLFGDEEQNRQISADEMEDCVSWTFPQLTRREVAVCARSIIGVTAEGIALDLGIKQTSVLTYRRRAYARLNISSINQLSSMLIQSSAARKLAMAS